MCPISEQLLTNPVALFPCLHKVNRIAATTIYGEMEFVRDPKTNIKGGGFLKTQRCCIACGRGVTAYYPDPHFQQVVEQWSSEQSLAAAPHALGAPSFASLFAKTKFIWKEDKKTIPIHGREHGNPRAAVEVPASALYSSLDCWSLASRAAMKRANPSVWRRLKSHSSSFSCSMWGSERVSSAFTMSSIDSLRRPSRE